jgi:hypothetical protein
MRFTTFRNENLRRFMQAGLVAVVSAAVLAAPPVGAASVALAPVTIGAPLQSALHDRYGEAEGAVLQDAVTKSLSAALRKAGGSLDGAAALRIEVSIEAATPTHPTRRQLNENPSLDYLKSVARGGATLHAVLRDAGGKQIDRVDYDRYAATLDEASLSGSAWGDALLAIDRFAAQVVKAWRRHSRG